jgi:hypothetical protein
MDKSWETEPDSLDFEAEGLRCAMLRNSFGIWCGYVGIDKDHPWFGLPYNTLIKPTPDMLENRSFNDTGVMNLFVHMLSGRDPNQELEIGSALRVHGGITFSDFREDGLFYYGFDCGHAGDLMPGMLQYHAELPSHLRGVYRDQQYVVSECQQLATQLVRIAARFCANVNEKER